MLQRARRSGNGYREYPEQALLRVRMIRQALSLGFTLDELSEVFKIADRGGIPCQRVRNLAGESSSIILSFSLTRDLQSGNLKRASHPRTSSRFSRVSVPPCASAICRESTKPIPEPAALVVKNGTNRFAVLAKPAP